MKTLFLILIGIGCCFTATAQTSREKIFNVYRVESKHYFDSTARAEYKEFSKWNSQYLLNVSKLESILKKFEADSLNSNDEKLMKDIDQALLNEFKLPSNYFKKIKKKLNEKPGY